MPDCNGADVTARMRPMGNRTPIVGVSAVPEARKACREAGMDDVIAKPFTKEQIHSAVWRYAQVQDP